MTVETFSYKSSSHLRMDTCFENWILNTVKSLYKDHLWYCPKVVLKTTLGQSQRWSLIRGTLGVENEEKNNLNSANKVFNR